jgi:hypothetical protein
MQSPNAIGTIIGTIMWTRRLTWLVLGLGLAVVLVAAFTAYPLHPVSLRREAVIDAAIQSGPLTISVSYGAGRGLGGDWELLLGESGNATLKINSYPTGKSANSSFRRGNSTTYARPSSASIFSTSTTLMANSLTTIPRPRS